MSLQSKKGRDPSQLPTLSYEIKLTLPTAVDSNPQEISFLDLVANDAKFKNDKESLELVLSSYVKACGKQSVKEILAENETTAGDKASLADIIRALMDYNDQQNANLGVGYTDPEDDDSFIDDSTAAQDNIPKNMTNERDGFYVNEKHQPIQARYVSESSASESDGSGDDDDDSDDDSDSNASGPETEPTEKNKQPGEPIEKDPKKRKIDDDAPANLSNPKRKRSVSEASTPILSANLGDQTKNPKISDESVKKVKKLSETTSEPSQPTSISYVLPTELEHDIKPALEKLIKSIQPDLTGNNTVPKKIERLYEQSVCRELLDLAKKLHRHTNANRQLVFDIFSARTGLSTSFLITRTRLLMLNDYEPNTKPSALNDLREKLKVEIHRSLELQVQSHNQAVKEWQQKMNDNPSKDKNRGPRKNFRFHKTINELIIRCVDRKLETLTMLDTEALELFLHDQIVSLWEQTGWMTPKKIIGEVIRMEYRPLRDTNIAAIPSASSSSMVTNAPLQAVPRLPSVPAIAERVKKEPLIHSPPTATKVSHSQSSPKPSQQPSATRLTDPKVNEPKSSLPPSTIPQHAKPLEMATRVTTNVAKQSNPRPLSTDGSISQISEQSATKATPSDAARAMPKSATSTPSSDPSVRRPSSTNPHSVIDLTMDLSSQCKKSNPDGSARVHSHSSPIKDSASPHRSSSSSLTSNSKQPHQQQQQFSSKIPSEKPPAGSFLKEVLLTGVTSTPSASASPKVASSPLAVDNMLSKSMPSPKTSTYTSAIKSPAMVQSPSHTAQRSSGSTKVPSNRSSTDLTHHRSDHQAQAPKVPSSSSHRSSTNTVPSSSSSSASTSARRSTTSGIAPGFSSSHEPQSSRGHISQNSMMPGLPPGIQWDSATLQFAAAAFANPELLSSSGFDPHLLHSMLASAANIVSGNSSSPSSSASRQPHSQNNTNHRRS